MSNTFASHTISPFMPVRCPRCPHSYFRIPYNLSSRFNYRCYRRNVSTQLHVEYKMSFSFVSMMSSVILMMRTYAFSGRKKHIPTILSITYIGLVGVIIWVINKKLSSLSEDIAHRGESLTLRSVTLIHCRRSQRMFCPKFCPVRRSDYQ